jgi:hypothetical protein
MTARYECRTCGAVGSHVTHSRQCRYDAAAVLAASAPADTARKMLADYDALFEREARTVSNYEYAFHSGSLSDGLRLLLAALDKTARGEDL